MKQFYLFSFLTSMALFGVLSPETLQAQVNCVEIFYNRQVEEGFSFREELESLNGKPFTPEAWELLGTTKENTHNTYLIPLKNITAVVKFGERPHTFEALAYEIASLLGYEMPVTIQVKMGDQTGMAQVYLADKVTLLDFSSFVDPSPHILIFDRMTLLGDRNNGNVLIPKDFEVAPRLEDQIMIDNEGLFFPGHATVKPMIQEGPTAFLTANMATMKSRFPLIHQRYLDPEVQNKIIGLMGKVPEARPHIEYVEEFFKAYAQISKLPLSKAAPRTSRPTEPLAKPGLFDRFLNRYIQF